MKVARRYVWISTQGLAGQVSTLVPAATVTDSGGYVEAIVPEAVVPVLDGALPASPITVEPVAEGAAPSLCRPVRADQYDAIAPLVEAARLRLTTGTLAQVRTDLGALITALDGLISDADARPIDPISRGL